jgi:hypothetical protein
MRALSSGLRKQLEKSVLAARRAAESASRAALETLGVFADRRPEHLDADRAVLRIGLRAKWRQLGSDRELLVAECAYEQWHRLLFARFLAENSLLLHPRFKAPVTLADCEELASELNEPDAWSVAARFAAEILPGIFKLDDPCVQLRLAPEGRDALERILDEVPAETFVADDALGWVYQFWQKDKKDEVNDSERKIGGADLGPVTQLFTENYMVRFLLENSLGAWWAARHPASPLVAKFDYLRFDESGSPAAGSFNAWPDRVAEVTVMDPCCGSGHFLVEAFSMLWRMRAEEEGLAAIEAQDAVLRDNLFGLELDPRCVQIAMFAVALQAWKAGGRWRELPVPNIACSGIPVRASVDEWKALADADHRLENALIQLHTLLRDADTLGSLIDPTRAAVRDPDSAQGSLDEVDWSALAPLIARATTSEHRDPATAVLGRNLESHTRAVELLGRSYSLVVTNVPYLTRNSHAPALADYCARRFSRAKHDLATVFLERALDMLAEGGALFLVCAQNWLFMPRYEALRRHLLAHDEWLCLGQLGEGAFQSPQAAGAFVCLLGVCRKVPITGGTFMAINAQAARAPERCAELLRSGPVVRLSQADQNLNPDARILFATSGPARLLAESADSRYGLRTGDANRFIRAFWEIPKVDSRWRFHQGTPSGESPYSGREAVLLWSEDGGLHEYAQAGVASLQGADAWGRSGVVVKLTRDLTAALYTGESFDNNVAVVWPHHEQDLPALWAFLSSPEYTPAVRQIDQALKVMNATLLKVPFDLDRWRAVADANGPLPDAWSNDPTQWLFDGRPEASQAPLQVAIGRLVGYRWPAQLTGDDLNPLADADGIVCLPSVAGEAPASVRLQQVLARAFDVHWSPGKTTELLEQADSRKQSLADWLRDEFFKQHCALFSNRPFVWHIWDGLRDGFSALVNYHRLDRKTLEKLTFTYLGQDWIERQRAEARDEVAGAEARLSAAVALQRKLERILEGEAPFDIYVRWKPKHAQPIGWDPDLNDGVRLNIRPFVEAGVLRAPFSIHWRKDRGKNPDGSERQNDVHLTLIEKQIARAQVGPP